MVTGDGMHFLMERIFLRTWKIYVCCKKYDVLPLQSGYWLVDLHEVGHDLLQGSLPLAAGPGTRAGVGSVLTGLLVLQLRGEEGIKVAQSCLIFSPCLYVIIVLHTPRCCIYTGTSPCSPPSPWRGSWCSRPAGHGRWGSRSAWACSCCRPGGLRDTAGWGAEHSRSTPDTRKGWRGLRLRWVAGPRQWLPWGWAGWLRGWATRGSG